MRDFRGTAEGREGETGGGCQNGGIGNSLTGRVKEIKGNKRGGRDEKRNDVEGKKVK